MFDWFLRRGFTGRRASMRFAGMALLLVAEDLMTRLVLRLIAPEDQADPIFGLPPYAVVLLTTALLGSMWVRRYVLARVWAYLAAAALPAAMAIGLLGPWVSGQDFGGDGAKLTVLRMLLTVAVLAAGAVIGVLGAVALAQDLTGRAWKAQAEQVLAKRKRVKL